MKVKGLPKMAEQVVAVGIAQAAGAARHLNLGDDLRLAVGLVLVGHDDRERGRGGPEEHLMGAHRDDAVLSLDDEDGRAFEEGGLADLDQVGEQREVVVLAVALVGAAHDAPRGLGGGNLIISHLQHDCNAERKAREN